MTKRPATVIALARHRAVIVSYEAALGQQRTRCAELGRLFEVERQNAATENGKLLRRNIQLKHQLEAIEERECTPFWAVVWTAAGALAATSAFVCLSLLVWP
jgi:hypothetical protein